MNNCTSCGSIVPEGQVSCSRCYGDIAHGNDGYYEDWAREQLEVDYRERLLMWAQACSQRDKYELKTYSLEQQNKRYREGIYKAIAHFNKDEHYDGMRRLTITLEGEE